MFGLFSKKNLLKTDSNVDQKNFLFERLDEDLGRTESTDDPHSFFLCYKDAVDACAELLSLRLGDEIDNQILKTLHYLFGNKTEITNKFLERSSSSGRLSYDTDAIIEHKNDMTADSYDYFLSLTGLDELFYTYCTVTFGGTHTYDYICEIPNISVGDDVIVPVGEEETEKLAKVTAISEYRYDEVPYPVSKTKRIIAKYGCGL
ncbi:MAG: hypothetical protein IJ404_00750 [Clostridia bacterium]|nr:hypothetical protein [Clostridia bacterium]